MESEKLAQQLIMDPIDSFIDSKKATWAEKASTRASQIERRWEQFANAPFKKAVPSSLVGTLDAAININDAENIGIYGEDYDIEVTTHPMVQTKMTLLVTSS
jgi:hypothetical protein